MGLKSSLLHESYRSSVTPTLLLQALPPGCSELIPLTVHIIMTGDSLVCLPTGAQSALA